MTAIDTWGQPGRKASENIEARLLRWLLHYTLQRIADIALGIRASEQTVYRHLQTLVSARLVESVLFSYSSRVRQPWYHLTDAGIEAAAALESLTAAEAVRTWKTDEWHLLHLLPRLPALLCVQNVINAIIVEAPEVLASHGNPAAIRWRWQREYQISFQDRKQRTAKCAADAAVVLRRSARGDLQDYFVLWIYADVGIAGGWSRALMTARLRQLLLYRESLERQPYRTQFPLVLVLTESALQGARWHEAASNAAYGLGKPLTGAVLNLATSPFPPIWEANFRLLATHQACHLVELLQPMTRAAIPSGILPAIPPIRAIGPIVAVEDPTPKRVKGQFQRRLEQIVAKPTATPKEREIVALLGLAMSQRYRDVLLLLYAHPLTSEKDLAVFLNLAQRSVLRYFQILSGWHCIETVNDRKRGQTRWKLTERGLRYLAASQRLPLPSITETDEEGITRQIGVSSLQKHMRHTAGVYRYLSAIHEASRAQRDHRILWFESLYGTRRYQYQGKWHNFRPDAILLYEQGTGAQTFRWLLWLEWDEATMTQKQLREKLLSYRHYMRSREFRRLGYSVGSPLLLFVTPERGQADTLRDLAEETLQGTPIQVLIALRSLFEAHDFLSPIWYQAVPVLESEQRSILKRPFPASG